MNKQQADKLYLDLAERCAQESHARRTKVGSVLEKNGQIISHGWNGTPPGRDNNCEYEGPNGELITKPEVLHAELNTILKLANNGGVGANGATLYVTLSPCQNCANLINRAGISRVVYKTKYRDISGIKFLQELGVLVEQYEDTA